MMIHHYVHGGQEGVRGGGENVPHEARKFG